MTSPLHSELTYVDLFAHATRYILLRKSKAATMTTTITANTIPIIAPTGNPGSAAIWGFVLPTDIDTTYFH